MICGLSTWWKRSEVALQRRVGAADLVEPRDQRRDGAGGVAVPAANLVLLAVEVLFAAGLGGKVLAELVRGAVDAVACASVVARMTRCMKAGRPPVWSEACRMSGVLGQTLGVKKSETGGRVISSK